MKNIINVWIVNIRYETRYGWTYWVINSPNWHRVIFFDHMSDKTCKSYISINPQQNLDKFSFLLTYYEIFKQFVYQNNVKTLYIKLK